MVAGLTQEEKEEEEVVVRKEMEEERRVEMVAEFGEGEKEDKGEEIVKGAMEGKEEEGKEEEEEEKVEVVVEDRREEDVDGRKEEEQKEKTSTQEKLGPLPPPAPKPVSSPLLPSPYPSPSINTHPHYHFINSQTEQLVGWKNRRSIGLGRGRPSENPRAFMFPGYRSPYMQPSVKTAPSLYYPGSWQQ